MKNVFAIAGPTGSGKDSIIRGLIARYPRIVFAVNATTRSPRPQEESGVNYYFLSREDFLTRVDEGQIPEHYHRADTDTYYGLYKPDLDAKLRDGKIVAFQIQIVGARYLKEQYGATTFFIMPGSLDAFEHRVRARSAMTEAEWEERLAFTRREIADEAPWYDYRIVNEEGRLNAAIEEVVAILKKEGYVLE
ncbi:hypothetical protein KGO06_01855 [Patescibacteria group bacterium]|nr:hypothetical protein [Patescibacteria group bacterium]